MNKIDNDRAQKPHQDVQNREHPRNKKGRPLGMSQLKMFNLERPNSK
jgi:hypothetical protein